MLANEFDRSMLCKAGLWKDSEIWNQQFLINKTDVIGIEFTRLDELSPPEDSIG